MEAAHRVQWIRRLSVLLVVMTFSLMVLGSWVKATGSGLSCPDWPQCYGEWLPPFPSIENGGTWETTDANGIASDSPVLYTQAQILYEWGHRALASLVAPVLLALAFVCLRGRELDPALRFLPTFAGFVLIVQIGIGGATVLQGNPAATTTLHLATATLFFFLTAVTLMFAFLRPLARGGKVVIREGVPAVMYPGETLAPTPEQKTGRPVKAIMKDFMDISKPRIILLLLIVAWAAMFVAAQGRPPLNVFLAVTAAGTFSTAASGAFNNVIERERDSRMGRTASRPVASGRLSPGSATLYASILTLLSIASLLLIGAWLAALLTAGAIAYYVVVYTVWLKPTTPQNIVIGGLAGSFPAVIGWSALTGTIAWPAIVIASLVFLWTPAHFWALALLYKHDYAAADYPMMPNVAGEQHTRRLILVYSVLTVLASIGLVYPFRNAGWIYLVAALLLGFLLTTRAAKLETNPSPKAYRTFFLWTIQYLGFLLVALMIDQVAFYPVL